MTFLQVFSSIVLFGGGIFYLSIAITNWEYFFITHHRVKYMVELFTRNGARVFYALLGVASFVGALLILLAGSPSKKTKPASHYFEFRSNKPVEVERPVSYYSSDCFRSVSVKENEDGLFVVTGSARVFEATFSWVVKSGKKELADGHEMTDAGAPEWGNFDFTIDIDQLMTNDSVTLILFEVSAKDGSRQHELSIPFN